MVNGGQKLASTYLNAPTDINLSFSHLGSEEEILVSRPVPAFPQRYVNNDKYVDPIVYWVEIEDPAIDAAVSILGTCAISTDLTFHVVVPDDTVVSWSSGNWAVISRRPPNVLIPVFRAGMVEAIQDDAEAFRLIDQGTQSPDNALSAMQRVFDVANTFDAEYFDHETDPIIAGYLKPFTTDMEIDKAVRTIIRKMAPNVGLLAFTPKTRDGAAPECVICKLDNHLAYICPFTRATPPGGAHLISSLISSAVSSAGPPAAEMAAAAALPEEAEAVVTPAVTAAEATDPAATADMD
ncbi:hypothetical protein B0H13DRAFT_1894165 [Mycena leptocephala]|nr:hypothetical protein B0H13DRAFT_1894165 [Mycena leptocephala]